MQISNNTLLMQLPGLLLIKDLNSTYLGGSMEMTKFFSYSSPEHLKGENDFTIKHNIAKYGEMFVETDNRLKKTGQPYNGCYIFPIDGIERAFIFKKSFLKNDQGNNIGIIALSLEINNLNVEKKIISSYQDNYHYRSVNQSASQHYLVNDDYPEVKFTKRESECLFYLLRGKSSTQIASILHISPRTVESYTEQIKQKMLCDNKSQLIEKAIEKGFINIIPPSIIKI